ncbi:sensor histidine kinase [Anaerocolumna sp. MB42-C2]|uniref:sensor histidine kinase n=1 Tax=Anaerocolumna sp. MB42-C2 TaxID=3070997 RepID=UPI0027E1C3A6|nr:ATP-binding protein [Anaerocolumna sp. MB42-C2]WMJ85528.1 ATP-binding protein [Anaerocolumna sp. MB42-C2]
MGLLNFLFGRMIDNRIAAFQNDLITKHCDEVQNIYGQMRGWRHDYHNHLQTMKAHLALGQTGELSDYLGKLDRDLTSVDTMIKTGNVMIDAILNSKISLAVSRKINVNTKATVPGDINISEVDLCVIIGNLLDNAMEACLKQPNETERFIRVYIGILKEQLYISVTNSVGGEIKKSGKTYISTKDSASHGFGLMRTDKIADKYSGYINRQNEDGVFATEVMLPL